MTTPLTEPAWLEIAKKELGIHETPGPKATARIVEYLSTTGLPAEYTKTDETPWCSAFVCWCLEKAGIESPKTAWARSFLTWGHQIYEPRPGSIVIFSRGVDSGHVAFFLRRNAKAVTVLGGNQSDAVTIAAIPLERVLGYRHPLRENLHHDYDPAEPAKRPTWGVMPEGASFKVVRIAADGSTVAVAMRPTEADALKVLEMLTVKKS